MSKRAKKSERIPSIRLSMREYAQHRKDKGLTGGSHQAVSKAIKDGRLTDRSIERRGRRWLIDPERADAEWAAMTTASKLRDPDAIAEGKRSAKRNAPAQPGLFGELGDDLAGLEPSRLAGAESGQTKAALDRVQTAVRTKLLLLELKERTGELVNKADVSSAVFGIFRQAREELLQVPERISDLVAAEADPQVVRKMIRGELVATLERLSHDVKRL